MSKSFKFWRGTVIFWTLFIGVGAVGGSMMFFLDPAGGFIMQDIQKVMQEKMPFGDLLFSNMIFPGIALLIVNGLSNLTAFILILKQRKLGYILGYCFGITLMLWITIQFILFAPKIYAIDIVYFSFGLLQFICGYIAYVRYAQYCFRRENVLKTIPISNDRELVVYFSRDGYTEKLAYKKAFELGCGIYRIETAEPIKGDLGFWWCGRFAMHRWGMKLTEKAPILESYEKIHLFTPIWVFSICAPVRQFLIENPEIKVADATIIHFMNGNCGFAFRELEDILGEKLYEKHSICCRLGKIKVIS